MKSRLGYWAPVWAAVVATVYVFSFFVMSVNWLGPQVAGVVAHLRGFVYRAIDGTVGAIGLELSYLGQNGVYLLVMGAVVPWAVMVVLGRGRARELGFRMPNGIGWRVVLVGYVVALPFQFWMAGDALLAAGYLSQFREAGATTFAGYYLVNMASEHFLLQGVLLAAFRSGLRWPEPAGVAEMSGGRIRRVFRWLGLAQPTDGAIGLRKVTRWIGLQGGCVFAIVMSGLLFGAVHLGKAPREAVLSVPGGFAIAYVAYRTNSWLTPFALHVVTAGTAFLLMLRATS